MGNSLWAAILAAASAAAAVPTPAGHLGFRPGDDYKLADYSQIITYFQKLEKSSGRIRLRQFGRSSMGRPMYVAFLSDETNLARLDEWQRISRRMALGQPPSDEARKLASQGKAVVWIDSGLHSTEVAPAQHAPELAYQVITGETDELRRIRRNVILMQIPVINPDGLEMTVEWYRRNVGTPHELAPLPMLYQKYAGHDNNRDYFMLNLEETRHVTRLLFEEWFPHIVYNQHQSPAFPARIFLPPYAEPLNPNIPAAVMQGIHLIGSAMAERLARENKPGALSYFGFDGWWNGGLRSVPAFHNMHGILTETAGNTYATPRTHDPRSFPERFASGMPTREPSIFYQRPWMGGRWSLRDAIEYMLTADFAILDLAATRHEHFLWKAWEMARQNIDAGAQGKPYAYVVPGEQWDASSAVEMLRRLALAGIEVRRARAGFRAGGKTFAAGDWVLLAGQPFRGYLVDLMEPQRYPEIRAGVTGPTKRPYDLAGWTLRMQMGVQVERLEEPFDADLEAVVSIPPPAPALDHRQNSSFLAMAELLERGKGVKWGADGAVLVQGESSRYAEGVYTLRRPRLALYEPFTGNIDKGWTEWLLDTYKVTYTAVRNQDFQKGGLRARFDTILFAAQSPASILHGVRAGERGSGPGGRADLPAQISLQRPEYTGGIGLEGLAQLEQFVRQGGTVIALDSATGLPMEYFPLPVRGLLRGSGEGGSPGGGYYCPGSLLRITVDNSHPLAFGMPKDAIATSTGGQAFEITLLEEANRGDREVKVVARYAASNLLASGWVSGERAVLGKPILVEARHGKGRVILFGFRPQFRGQSFGTFKLLLNAIYLGSAALN